MLGLGINASALAAQVIFGTLFIALLVALVWFAEQARKRWLNQR